MNCHKFAAEDSIDGEEDVATQDQERRMETTLRDSPRVPKW